MSAFSIFLAIIFSLMSRESIQGVENIERRDDVDLINTIYMTYKHEIEKCSINVKGTRKVLEKLNY